MTGPADVTLGRLRTRYPDDRDVFHIGGVPATEDRDVHVHLRHDEEWHCPDCSDGSVLWEAEALRDRLRRAGMLDTEAMP